MCLIWTVYYLCYILNVYHVINYIMTKISYIWNIYVGQKLARLKMPFGFCQNIKYNTQSHIYVWFFFCPFKSESFQHMITSENKNVQCSVHMFWYTRDNASLCHFIVQSIKQAKVMYIKKKKFQLCPNSRIFPNLVECLKRVRDPRHLGVMCVTARCFHS